MVENPPWEANSHSASQEILRLFFSPKFHFPVYKSPPLVPILSQMHLLHTFPPYFPKIHFNIIFHLRQYPSSGSSFQVFLPKYSIQFS